MVRFTVTGTTAGGCEIVTVPVLLAPPVTLVGANRREVTVNGFTVRVVVWFLPAKVAVIVIA